MALDNYTCADRCNNTDKYHLDTEGDYMSKIRLNNLADIRRTLARVASEVESGEIDSKSANVIVYCCQTALTVQKLQLIVDEKNDTRDLHLGLDFGKVFDI